MSQAWNINIWYFFVIKMSFLFRSDFWWFLSDFRFMIATWKLAFILHINILPIVCIGQLLYSFRLKIVNKAIMGKWEKKSTGNLSNKQWSYCPPTEELSKFVFLCKDQPCIFWIIQSCISVQRSDQTDRTCLQTIRFLKQYASSSSFFIKDIFAFSLLQGSIVFMFCSATALWL